MLTLSFILVGFSVFRLNVASCPHACNCSETQLLCMDKKFEKIPNLALLDNPLQIIDFSGNKLIYIGSEDFSFATNDAVQEIYLNNSQIVEIERGAFEEMENLQELYLGQNLLNGVDEFIIEPLDSMVVLDLSNNYFNGDMPVIRSKSLEVLAMANSKVSNIPKNALKHLPNLKLLLLQQNNLKTIPLDVFDNFKANSIYVRLNHNPFECNCQNLDLFQMLQTKEFIDVSEPYQCILKNGTYVDIFGKNGVIDGDKSGCEQGFMKKNLVTNELHTELSSFKEVRSMVDDQEAEKHHLLRIFQEENSTAQFENDNEKNCQDFIGLFYAKFRSGNSFFMLFLTVILLSFFIGILTGVLVLKVMFAHRYQKLAQDSESTSKLVFQS